ncbi:MAG TPA: DUF2309 domain-containing protein [Planctomycetaceae bacterium]|nr:DUF2309 domain-containing protein [Planctomycetaceae bacterium]
MKQPEEIEQIVHNAAQLLPAQGPVTAFAFLNSLQALEHLPFEEGLARGRDWFGCETYLSEVRYREKLDRGRIRLVDLQETLRQELGEHASEQVGPHGTVFDLRMAMLANPVRSAPVAELNWFMAETDAQRRYRPEVSPEEVLRLSEETRLWALRDVRRESNLHWSKVFPEINEATVDRWTDEEWRAFSLRALWEVCAQGVRELPIPLARCTAMRHRDLLQEFNGVDCDEHLHEFLIPFCAAFIDQGLATLPLPQREAGFWKSFSALHRARPPVEAWLQKLPQTLQQLDSFSAAEIIARQLEDLGIPDREAGEFLTRELLALRGYAGTLWQGEDRGDRFGRPLPKRTLLEYVAVRLTLLKLALAHFIKDVPGCGSVAALRTHLDKVLPSAPVTTLAERTFALFQIAQLMRWSAAALSHLTAEQWETLISEVTRFDDLQRRRMFHLAFERRFRVQALDALAIHNRGRTAERVAAPRFQSVYCIDTREQSFRRHLEEICPSAETFATAGFFGVAMYYKGVADAHFQALCPIVVRPKNYVVEEVVYSLAESHRLRSNARKRLATASHQFHIGSRSIAGGALLAAGLGVMASVPLVARVLFPLTTSRIRRTVGSVMAPPPVTRLRLERLTAEPGDTGDAIGYSLKEMADVGERVLNEIGVGTGFSRLMFFFGHGSFCLNNPHKSCYDCGACSGSAGGPNARALAAMLNDRRVRALLIERGIVIPEDTVFVGGMHNTATDTMTYYDLDLLPRSHFADFEFAREQLDAACQLNAQERCRRFYSAPLDISPVDAMWHVENRTEDLAQTRPEFGNASNAMCVVGRRCRTRGLYLDRRSFLVSYDPTIDDEESTILGRILGAVVVVCSGINLQYFFSYIDPSGWGAGTKLPHNVTSLLGVMDGAMSDLRSGLPWQGVEIHEPVRLLMVIEALPAALEKIMNRNAAVGNILRNGWMQLALMNPHTAELSLYQNGEYVPYVPTIDKLPQVQRSVNWYQGWREHLDFAQILSTTASGGKTPFSPVVAAGARS